MPVERAPGGTSLIDVLDRVLDKGIIIDAWVRISLVGIDLVTVEARVVVPRTNADDPIVAVLRNGFPQRVPDARVDERLDRSVRDLFATLGLGPFVVAPLRSTAGRPVSGDGKHAPSPGWETRGEWAGVVLLSRASGVTQADVEALVPFGRRAGETLNRQRDVELLRETSEAHAIEKEWLWWMVNGLGDAVLLTDSNNDIILENRRAELLFRASDEDSAGKRRAVWMNN